MTSLAVGATGATGKVLVSQLPARGGRVKSIARSIDRLPDDVREHPDFSAIGASVLELTGQELTEQE